MRKRNCGKVILQISIQCIFTFCEAARPDEEDPIPALKKRTNGKEAITSEDKEIKKLALREKLAQNGFAL